MRRTALAVSSAAITGISLAVAGPAAAAPATTGTAPEAGLIPPAYADVQHPVLAALSHAEPRTYTVRDGDTLTSIARAQLGHGDRWPALWMANRGKIPNPNAIRVRERLRLPASHAAPSQHVVTTAYHAIPAPPVIVVHPADPWHQGGPVGTFTASTAQATAQAEAPSSAPAPAPVAAPPASTSYSAASGSFQNCVIQAESGGNASAVNGSTGAGGLYGFMPSTWQSLGYSGNPQDAPVSVQNQAFAREYARAGSSPWSAYDGC